MQLDQNNNKQNLKTCKIEHKNNRFTVWFEESRREGGPSPSRRATERDVAVESHRLRDTEKSERHRERGEVAVERENPEKRERPTVRSPTRATQREGEAREPPMCRDFAVEREKPEKERREETRRERDKTVSNTLYPLRLGNLSPSHCSFQVLIRRRP